MLFEYGGFPPTNREASLLQLNFLFLGDHVERSGVWRRSVFYFPTKSITREPFPSMRKPRMSFHQASTESMDSMMDSTADSVLRPLSDQLMFQSLVSSAICFGLIKQRCQCLVDEPPWNLLHLAIIFSAPNYCGDFDNTGAMISVDEILMYSFQTLKHVERRPWFLC
ncbi:LOW QUALITY PROTEIN: hypothetical protein HID58_079396 [Brassica napus]|uniref:protein-serine/threonine phosphatase n=1 Tax=Brassica napus TaxID=3708 RepID=A0ABQ7Y4X3_BRANA|nr:LOW QUALITY PROTEIN: hypothetical protein HID58_079396 [Brassica napus]